MDAAVDIRPTYSALSAMLAAAPVRALAWGQQPVALRWNTPNRIEVPAGTSHVGVWATWVTKKHMGLVHAVVQLAPGEVVSLEWKAPNSIFGTGKLTVVELGPPTALAAPDGSEAPGELGPELVRPPHATRPVASVPLAATTAAVAGPAGRWEPDPTGRFAHRWWDGARWTEAVSDGATTSSDPI
ncbi:MAG TPA: DUF2510 domain-containing protein [Iamia sp.]|nr:DUF2510 domain-containing protein [Iamia sp.]